MTALVGNSLFWYGLALKIAMTASIVVAASIVVERSGPFIGSLIAALPTAGGAAMIILHRRVGGPATAAVMANAVIGLGFAVAVLVLNLAAEPFGSAVALALALLVAVGANLMIYVVRQRLAVK